MIVVEGPDGAGKTSLVTRLKEDIPSLQLMPRAVNSSAEIETPVDTWVEETLKRGAGPYIYDRHQLISMPIYAPTLKHTLFGRFQSRRWFFDQIQKFWALEPFVVICLPPLEIVKTNVNRDPSSEVVAKDIETFYWLYHYWASLHYPSCWVWDYSSGGAHEFYPLLKSEVRRCIQATGG